MNNKGLITALIIIILLGGVIYFTLAKDKETAGATGITTTSESANTTGATVPTNQASSDDIIDFMVDDLAKDETKAAETSIESTSPSPSSDTSASLNTDF